MRAGQVVYECPNCHGLHGLHSGMDECPPDPPSVIECRNHDIDVIVGIFRRHGIEPSEADIAGALTTLLGGLVGPDRDGS